MRFRVYYDPALEEIRLRGEEKDPLCIFFFFFFLNPPHPPFSIDLTHAILHYSDSLLHDPASCT